MTLNDPERHYRCFAMFGTNGNWEHSFEFHFAVTSVTPIKIFLQDLVATYLASSFI